MTNQSPHTNYRLALDLGTNSIGWAVLSLDSQNQPTSIIDGNSFIFNNSRDPQSKESLAKARRDARQARRQRDRRLKRKKQIIRFLSENNLFPKEKADQKNLEKLDPYKLRFEALSRPLDPFELGRVLFALGQRRGYKSSRKDGQKTDDGKLLKTLNAFETTFEESGYQTLGEYLWKEKQTQLDGDLSNNIQRVYGVRSRAEADPFPYRDLYEQEFDCIRTHQEPHHALSTDDWEKIRDIIYFQRPLKPVERGYCSIYFNDKKPRADRYLPAAETFIAWQTVHNLRIITPNFEKKTLTLDQKSIIISKLSEQKKLAFKKIKSLLNLDDACHFNLESTTKQLTGMPTHIEFKKLIDAWDSFSERKKNEIVSGVFTSENQSEIIQKATTNWGLSEATAQALANLDVSKFATGTLHFCTDALEQLNTLMKKNMDAYEAKQELQKTIAQPTHTTMATLPYYGYVIPEALTNSGKHRTASAEKETGIIGNPTVHVGLNNIRAVVNAVIARMGHPPTAIHLEIARDLKLSATKKSALEKYQKENKKTNERIAAALAELNQANTYTNRLKYKLWEELGEPKLCVYTGKPISAAQLYGDDVDIEHILPLTRTHDDSPANKTLSFRSANKEKGNKSPFEAFGHTLEFESILHRAQSLPKHKHWRFSEAAMDRFNDQFAFLDRQLHDTQYLSKVAKQYLHAICDTVSVVTGQLTAKLRHDWGLKKDRDNHHHHFVDAVVIGLTDASTVQKANVYSKYDRLEAIQFPCPLDKSALHKQLEAITSTRIVYHKKTIRNNGQLHEATNYGYIPEDKRNPSDKKFNLVYRKAFVDLTKKEIAQIRDISIRNTLMERTQGLADNSKEWKSVLDRYSQETGIKQIRLLKTDNPIIPIRHNGHTKWVVPGSSNHHMKVWQLPNGKVSGVIVRLLDINTPNYGTQSFRPKDKAGREIPTAKYLGKLHKGDMISLIHKGTRCTGVIKGLRQDGQIVFKPHNDGGDKSNETISISKWITAEITVLQLTVLGDARHTHS